MYFYKRFNRVTVCIDTVKKYVVYVVVLFVQCIPFVHKYIKRQQFKAPLPNVDGLSKNILVNILKPMCIMYLIPNILNVTTMGELFLNQIPGE
jgi:hypothetical protein